MNNKKDYKVELEGTYLGFNFVVLGLSMGHRYGYVQIPKNHKYYELGYNKIHDLYEEETDKYLEVHGGLTYSGGGENVEYPVESSGWWIGFNTAHYDDGTDINLITELAPKEILEHALKMNLMFPCGGEIRTTEYVINQCHCLIDQIRRIKWIN